MTLLIVLELDNQDDLFHRTVFRNSTCFIVLGIQEQYSLHRTWYSGTVLVSSYLYSGTVLVSSYLSRHLNKMGGGGGGTIHYQTEAHTCKIEFLMSQSTSSENSSVNGNKFSCSINEEVKIFLSKIVAKIFLVHRVQWNNSK